MIIAIDPGKSGGIAVQDHHGMTAGYKMPDTEGDVVDYIRALTANVGTSEERTAYLEQVGGFTGEGQPGSAMFKFGEGFGIIKGALIAFGWRIIMVRPQVWQKRLGIGTKGAMSKTEWKNKLKAEAQRRFPSQTVTLATADALLILDYATAQEGA